MAVESVAAAAVAAAMLCSTAAYLRECPGILAKAWFVVFIVLTAFIPARTAMHYDRRFDNDCTQSA